MPPAHDGEYGLQIGLQTGPLGPFSSMHNRPVLQTLPGLQICPLPPVSVQVWAPVSQPSPFLQSASAAHCTQLPPVQTGVAGGQVELPVQPVEFTQVLLAVQVWPCGQSVLATHCTQAGNGLTRHTGVGALQSALAVQTGLQASETQVLPCGHCAVAVHCTQEPEVVSQCGVAGRDAQSLSEAHFVETQVFCGEQVSFAAQSAGFTQATQVLFLHAGVGGLQLEQAEGATQV